MDDAQIVSLFWKRDESAIEQTRQQYGPLCRRIAFNLVGDRQDAEECENDVYMAAWNAIPPARPQSLSAFLGRIARNVALNRFDHRSAAKRGGGEMPLLLSELQEVTASGSVEEMLDSKETAELIQRFLSGESAENRRLFLRRYWYGDPLWALAKQFGCSETAVKTRLFRQRDRLRVYLQKEGVSV